MTQDEINFLKSKIDNGTVNICFIDGEVVTARLISVSEQEEDVVYEIITSSTQAEKSDLILARFSEIKSASE